MDLGTHALQQTLLRKWAGLCGLRNLSSRIAVGRMPRPVTVLIVLPFAAVVSGCAPPPELTVAQEELVGRCLELAFKQESSPECAEQVTKPMEKAFMEKHPDFYDQLVAERKTFVEERLAEEQRQRDQMIRCLDQHELGNTTSAACEKFMPHEITRGLQDRRLRRCAAARLDGKPDAQVNCEGLPARAIEEEIELERSRRKRAPQADARARWLHPQRGDGVTKSDTGMHHSDVVTPSPRHSVTVLIL